MSTGSVLVLPLFVYGTLLIGEPAHRLIRLYVEASAPGRLAGVALFSLGRYPVAVSGGGHVIGELLWLRANTNDAALRFLDEYEGPQYTRERRVVRDLARQVAVDAWVYLGRRQPQPVYPRIEDGDWRAHIRRASVQDV